MQNASRSHKQDGRRTVVLKVGSISFGDTRMGCLVLNISDGGAGLVIENDAAIPFSFELEIIGERVRRRCVMVWRNERQIGVSFDVVSRGGR
jgi:hypothetical protein